MPRHPTIIITAAATGALALGVGIGVAGYAAADPTPSASPSASSAASPGPGAPGDHRGPSGGPGRGFRGGPGHGVGDDELAEQLASKLGVDETKVADALKAIREANRPARPSAAPSGSPTSTPPSSTSPSSTPGTSTPGTRPNRPDPAQREAELAKQLAAELGVDETMVTKAFDEIRAERQAEQAKALKTRLDAAVTAGTLTQAEADAVTKAVEKGVISGR